MASSGAAAAPGSDDAAQPPQQPAGFVAKVKNVFFSGNKVDKAKLAEYGMGAFAVSHSQQGAAASRPSALGLAYNLPVFGKVSAELFLSIFNLATMHAVRNAVWSGSSSSSTVTRSGHPVSIA